MEEAEEPSSCPFSQMSLKALFVFVSIFLGPIYDRGCYLVHKHIFTLSLPGGKGFLFSKEQWDLCKEKVT